MSVLMRKKLLLIILSLFLPFLFPAKAFAHVLKTDGSIGAVMHTDPDDDPIAGEQTGIFFEFKDKQNKFTPAACDCTLSILQSDKEIYSQPVFQNNPQPTLDNAAAFFTFPQRDTYQVKVTGIPLSSGAFQAFTLIYDVQVTKMTTKTPQPSLLPSPAPATAVTQKPRTYTSLVYAIGGGVLTTVIAAIVVKLRKRN